MIWKVFSKSSSVWVSERNSVLQQKYQTITLCFEILSSHTVYKATARICLLVIKYLLFPLGFAQHLQFNQDVFGCAHTSLSTLQFWANANL